jgi:hypothetical protein
LFIGNNFEELIFKFPNQAVPVIEKKQMNNGQNTCSLLREYPDAYLEISPAALPVQNTISSNNQNAQNPVQELTKITTPEAPKTFVPPKMKIPFDSIAKEQITKRRKLDVNPNPSGVTIFEDIDYGHRHFSILHWLFPNNFLPLVHSTEENGSGKKSEELYSSALRTLLNKKRHGGAHTNWSIIWEIILLSRLPNYDELIKNEGIIHLEDEIFQSLQKFFSTYLTNNYLTYHPALNKMETVTSSSPKLQNDRSNPVAVPPMVPGNGFQCETCFQERITPSQERRQPRYSVYSRFYDTGSSSALPPNQQSVLDALLSELLPQKGFETRFEDKVSNCSHISTKVHYFVYQ